MPQFAKNRDVSTKRRKMAAASKAALVLAAVLTALSTGAGCGAERSSPDQAQQTERAAGSAGVVPAAAEPPAAVPEGSFRFVVIGDSRGANSSDESVNETVLRGIFKQIKQLPRQPSFILFTGDAVKGGSNLEEQLTGFRSLVEEYYPMPLFYPAIGNHENDISTFSKVFFHLPDESVKGQQKTSYYFDYGNARFITINSNRTGKNREEDELQYAWLQQVLESNDKTHVFVQFHHPAYPITKQSYGTSLDRNGQMRDKIWDLLQKYNVDAVFVGHEHHYARRLVDRSFNANGFSFDNAIYQITSGGGGGPFNQKDPVIDVRNVSPGPVWKFHFLVVDVKGEKVEFQAIDNAGKPIDIFSVTRPAKK
jgi:hypothetical protein